MHFEYKILQHVVIYRLIFLQCNTLYCIILYCSILYYTILYYTTLCIHICMYEYPILTHASPEHSVLKHHTLYDCMLLYQVHTILYYIILQY